MSQSSTNQTENHFPHLAAIDLGSNSFHMIVVRIEEDGHVHVLDRLKEMVRLGGGLDSDNNLTEAIQQRALQCLERFGERIRHLDHCNVAAVGTNTMRRANNSSAFLANAERALGHPISIIAGREEARLIYLGVSHSLEKQDDTQRFVVDIGGGSTELIIGKNHQPIHLESLPLGCVSMSNAFFADGDLSKQHWERANLAAHLELRPFKKHYRQLGWDNATGASGTIKAIGKVIRELGWRKSGFALDDLYKLRDRLIDEGNIKKVDLDGLDDERRPVFAGGLAVLIAVFEALSIKAMQVSDGALREGLIYELLGRIKHEDIRTLTVQAMQQRFQVSTNHAQRISERALYLFDRVAPMWELSDTHRQLLEWSAQLHEVGLSISHGGYHKHSAYVVEEADLPGFSRREQNWMSVLVRNHRHKLSTKKISAFISEDERKAVVHSIVLLRLAVLFHRSRKNESTTIDYISVGKNSLCLQFGEGELESRPLMMADLRQEQAYLQKLDFTLMLS